MCSLNTRKQINSIETLLPAVHSGLLPDPATIIKKKMDRAGRLDLVFTYLVSRASKVLLAAERERESQQAGWRASRVAREPGNSPQTRHALGIPLPVE
jgi:hypothetical protein